MNVIPIIGILAALFLLGSRGSKKGGGTAGAGGAPPAPGGPGLPCGPNGECPDGHECVNGICIKQVGQCGDTPGIQGCIAPCVPLNGVCRDPNAGGGPGGQGGGPGGQGGGTGGGKQGGTGSGEKDDPTLPDFFSISADCSQIIFGDGSGQAWLANVIQPAGQQWVNNGATNPTAIAAAIMKGYEGTCFDTFPLERESGQALWQLEAERDVWMKDFPEAYSVLMMVRNYIDAEFFNGANSVWFDENCQLQGFGENWLTSPEVTAMIELYSQAEAQDQGFWSRFADSVFRNQEVQDLYASNFVPTGASWWGARKGNMPQGEDPTRPNPGDGTFAPYGPINVQTAILNRFAPQCGNTLALWVDAYYVYDFNNPQFVGLANYGQAIDDRISDIAFL